MEREQYLLCDACGHRMNIETLHAGLIGTLCPVCAADMLTKRDYRVGRIMLKLSRVFFFLSRILSVLMFWRSTIYVKVKFHVHDGKVTSRRLD